MGDSSLCNQQRMQVLLAYGDKLLQTCNHSWEAMLVELAVANV